MASAPFVLLRMALIIGLLLLATACELSGQGSASPPHIWTLRQVREASLFAGHHRGRPRHRVGHPPGPADSAVVAALPPAASCSSRRSRTA